MGDTTNFLIRYDMAATPEERADLLSREFRHQVERDVFQKIIDDPIARAVYELEFNGSVRFEDYAPLCDAGLVFELNDFYPRILYGNHQFDPIPDIALTPDGRRFEPDVPSDCDPSRFIAPYIQGYLWRSTSGGIVASRDPLNDLLQTGDTDVLRLIKNPETSTEYLPVQHPKIWDMMLDQTPIKDIDAARRSGLKWWTEEDRSTTFHDLSGQPSASGYYKFMDDDSYDEALKNDADLTYHDHYLSRSQSRP